MLFCSRFCGKFVMDFFSPHPEIEFFYRAVAALSGGGEDVPIPELSRGRGRAERSYKAYLNHAILSFYSLEINIISF